MEVRVMEDTCNGSKSETNPNNKAFQFMLCYEKQKTCKDAQAAYMIKKIFNDNNTQNMYKKKQEYN